MCAPSTASTRVRTSIYIHPEECIDCGACVPECPVEAIFPDDEVPEQYDAFTEKNFAHFDVPFPG